MTLPSRARGSLARNGVKSFPGVAGQTPCKRSRTSIPTYLTRQSARGSTMFRYLYDLHYRITDDEPGSSSRAVATEVPRS